jgi:hypothetical protein
MITKLENLPSNMVGFRAEGEITEKDFNEIVMPEVDRMVNSEGELNYLLVLDTSLKNFTMGAWLKDAAMGIKHLLKWNRAAIVTDIESVRTFTKGFSWFMPGEFKGFAQKDLQNAIDWTSGKS